MTQIDQLPPMPDEPNNAHLARLIQHSHSTLAAHIDDLGRAIRGTAEAAGLSQRMDRMEKAREADSTQREKMQRWLMAIGAAAAAGVVRLVIDAIQR